MGLKDKLRADMKQSMKAGDKSRLGVLRMLLSEMQYAKTALEADAELDDDAALKVVSTYHKRLSKSLDDFPEGEKRDQIRQEMAVVDSYLPKRASQGEIEALA